MICPKNWRRWDWHENYAFFAVATRFCLGKMFTQFVIGNPLPRLLTIHASTVRLYAVFEGLKKVRSRGWMQWLVCGGIVRRVMLFALASSTNSRDLWDWCPSKMTSNGCFSDGCAHLMKCRTYCKISWQSMKPVCDGSPIAPSILH